MYACEWPSNGSSGPTTSRASCFMSSTVSVAQMDSCSARLALVLGRLPAPGNAQLPGSAPVAEQHDAPPVCQDRLVPRPHRHAASIRAGIIPVLLRSRYTNQEPRRRSHALNSLSRDAKRGRGASRPTQRGTRRLSSSTSSRKPVATTASEMTWLIRSAPTSIASSIRSPSMAKRPIPYRQR